MTDVDRDWKAPGAGEWVRLADHFDRPWTAEYARVFQPAFEFGAAGYLLDYGMPVRSINVETVHGYPYLHPVPLVGPDSSRAVPASMLWLLARVVPALRRSERNAARALEVRPWRARAAQWWAEDRPRAIDANCAIAAVDPHAFDDHALARHLEAVEQLAADGYRLHFELHGTDMFPIGLFLATCRDRGIDVAAALDLVVKGSTPALGPRLAPADLGQCIISGYDIDRPRLCELPPEIVEGVTASDTEANWSVDAPNLVDEAVPVADRELFDIRLSDARAVFAVRDDNGVIVGAWRMGLLRRAYLAAGARLASNGLIERADHVLEAIVPEVVAMLEGTERAPIAAALLAGRADERERWAQVDPPLRLGTAADPPLHALPPGLRAVSSAQLVLRDLIERSVAAPALHGFGVGAGPIEGCARVVSSVDDAITRLEPGDVLIVRATSPAFNAVLPLAAALVTEHGGAISHAAIAARELGIPAVVGVQDATRKIRDGARVRVDPGAGVVTLLDPRPAAVG